MPRVNAIATVWNTKIVVMITHFCVVVAMGGVMPGMTHRSHVNVMTSVRNSTTAVKTRVIFVKDL